MRNVAIAILLSASAVGQVTARVVGVASQGSTVRASIEIVNNGAVSVFVQTCFHHWNQNAAEVHRRDVAICFAWPQHFVRGAWKDVPAQAGTLGDYSPQQGTTVPPGAARLEAEFSSCLSPVSPRDILRLRIGPSPDQVGTAPLFTTSFRLPHAIYCSR
jgi:hypothetical protein